MPFVVCGFEAGSPDDAREPDWDPDDVHETLAGAIAQARHWLQEFPNASVEVIEVRGAVGAVVSVVTTGGVEPVEAVWPAASARSGSGWFSRPPQVIVIGLALAAVGVWMTIWPHTFDDRPAGVVRVAGVAVVLFFGVGTSVAIVRWISARGKPPTR